MESGTGFLEKISEEFLNKYGNNIFRVAFVFPTKRAGLFFRKYLIEKITKNVWSPSIFSINDFIIQISDLNCSDQIELIFELYNVYKSTVKGYKKEFEDFYSWGKMIISDFNEIDKHLVDTAELFRNLREFKEIEKINIEEKSGIYKRFIGFWGDLGTIYKNFKNVLEEKNRAYEGMAYREVAENIECRVDIVWDKVIFCGFNAFTRAEEKIVKGLTNKNKAEIYWDMDTYFVEDLDHEAGYFFRENQKKFNNGNQIKWIDNNLSKNKNININGVQSKLCQAKILGIKLKELLQSFVHLEDIAIVLPDETMLFPVLNSMPESINKVNITVGFPLQQTPVYSLFNSIIEMHMNKFKNKFYYKDVKKVLNHPYIKPIYAEKIVAFLKDMKEENRVYIKTVPFLASDMSDLFKCHRNSESIIKCFLNLLDKLRTFYSVKKDTLFSIDFEFIYHFYTLLNKLDNSMNSNDLRMDLRIFWKLFTDIVNSTRIPFTGEPMEGLQIMGMLETQALNFNHVFILSVNEGSLPVSKFQQSFIPFDVRKKFGLPTYKERDAISAYHFYRLLKNSKNIDLLYTTYLTDVSRIEKNEKSRFIDQILFEYAEKNKNARITHQVFDFSFDLMSIKEIEVKKTSDIIKRLLEKKYSSSSLLNYLTCSLKFYFTYILNLKEEDEVYESPDYKIFGNIIHKTLERIYKPFLNAVVKINDLNRIGSKKYLESILDKTYKEESKIEEIDIGRNKIIFEVMLKFLIRFFEKERRISGFKILGLEKQVENIVFKFKSNSKEISVKLRGFIDRVDFLNGNHRIIDYKTGRTGSLNLRSMAELKGEEAVHKREAFQLFFYWYLLKKGLPDTQDFYLGIYPFKNIYDNLKLLKVNNSNLIKAELLDDYEGILESIFQEIFNLETPFSQTKETKNCQYCPYIHICNR